MDTCPKCTEPYERPKIMHLAIIVVVVAIIIYLVGRKGSPVRDKFVSARAKQVFDSAKPLFDQKQGKPSYSEYKMTVAGADPVQYQDLKNLWTKGTFTPENVQTSL